MRMEIFADYILHAPGEAQGALLDVLTFLRDKLPDAERRMYCSMPAFFRAGRCVIFVGAYKDHLGVCIGYDLVDVFKRRHPAYRYTKATILLPYGEPVPFAVLEEICEALEQYV